MNTDFWRRKRVLVTGHTGFKGAWLTEWLKKLGAEVTGFSLPPPTTPSLFELAHVAEGMRSVIGDVRDLPRLQSVFRETRPEVVFHLAAQSLVRESYRNPLLTYETNVMGTVHVLECIRQTGTVRAAVMVTSDKCYENRESIRAYGETDALGGFDPYSSSKACAELATAAYRRSFFSDRNAPGVATARAGNVIGGGDWAEDRLIPDVLKAFAAGRPAIIRNPHSVRPWQYVLDPLRGYLQLAEKLWENRSEYASAWNFGPPENDVRNVAAVVDRLCSLWRDGVGWKTADDTSTQPHEASTLRLDSSKAQLKLDWHTLLDLDTALQWVVEWHLAYGNESGACSALVQRDIDRFEKVAVAC